MGFPIETNNQQLRLSALGFVNFYQGAGMHLHLFANDYHPSPATVLADLTEATFDTYASKALAGVLGPPVKVLDGLYSVSVGVQQWVAPAASTQQVYGWWITDDSNGFILFAKRLDAPFLMTPGGGNLSIQINLDWASWGVVLSP